MENALLIGLLAATFAFGYLTVKRLDGFLGEHPLEDPEAEDCLPPDALRED